MDDILSDEKTEKAAVGGAEAEVKAE